MKRIRSLLLALMLLAFLLAGCGGVSTAPAVTDAPAEAPTEPQPEATDAIPAETPTETPVVGVASGADVIAYDAVEEDGMVPIGPEHIKDGVYDVEMKSSSSMFRADHCSLTVSGSEMYATLYMTSDAFLYMFAGTAVEAASSDKDDYILLEPSNQDGCMQFVLPLNALDHGESFAAFSRKKELWYDRTLLFKSTSLPIDAFEDGFIATANNLGLADGDYSIEVALYGGSGKSTISTPAKITVTNGECVAEIVWSSSKYDYVRIGEDMYLPVNTDGNSVFLIPILYFDYSMEIWADTTAMSQPHEIAYTLRFDSSTIHPVG